MIKLLLLRLGLVLGINLKSYLKNNVLYNNNKKKYETNFKIKNININKNILIKF